MSKRDGTAWKNLQALVICIMGIIMLVAVLRGLVACYVKCELGRGDAVRLVFLVRTTWLRDGNPSHVAAIFGKREDFRVFLHQGSQGDEI
ncbi:MAG TPA: hypothetical protein VHZ52_05880, partial [Acidobacteriaceae bacterium]|nr:hypothetical protein [Acidobacteriaceae bacterium]